MASKTGFIVAPKPLGYVANREITNLPGQYLVRGSQNTLVRNQEKVVSRMGYELLGPARTSDRATCQGSYDWKTNTRVERSVRVYRGILEALWGADTWVTVKAGLPTRTRLQFAEWWDSGALIDRLLMVWGTDEVGAWSGGMAEVASVTANTITKKGYLAGTTIAFNDNGADADTITDSGSGFVTAGFAEGDEIIVAGSASNNGTYRVASVAAGVITLDDEDELTDELVGASVSVRWSNGGTWAEARFDNAGTRAVVIDGVEYAYTGGESGGTLTGVTPDPTVAGVASGDVAVAWVDVSEPADLAGYTLDLISVMNNHVFFGDLSSRIVQVSKSSDYADFAKSTPRVPGEGFELTLDSCPTAFAPDEDDFYASGGRDDWYKISFQLAASTESETLTVRKLKTATGQAAVSQGGVFKAKNSTVFVSQEPTLDSLGRVENIDTTQSVPLSDEIRDDFEGYDFTDVHAVYFRRNAYVALPAEGLVLVRDMLTGYWQPPQTLPVARFAVINGALCGHSSVGNETYTLDSGYSDNGAPFRAVAAFGYEQYGVREAQKSFDELFTELYVSPETVVGHLVRYEYGGAADVREFSIDPNTIGENFIFSPSVPVGLGQGPLGSEPLGSSGDEEDPLVKIRVFDTTERLDFFERQRVFWSESDGCRFEILAHGENVAISDAIPTYLKR